MSEKEILEEKSKIVCYLVYVFGGTNSDIIDRVPNYIIDKIVDDYFEKDEEIRKLKQQLKEKEKEIEKLKANQTPTRKRLLPKNYDKLNIADKLRYKEKQVRIARIRLQEHQKMIDELDYELNKYKQHLAEKDKEIEYLRKLNFYKVSLKNEECLGVYPKNMEKIIRHQVCEEIRKKTQYFDDCWRIKEILDQIENGENDAKN